MKNILRFGLIIFVFASCGQRETEQIEKTATGKFFGQEEVFYTAFARYKNSDRDTLQISILTEEVDSVLLCISSYRA